MTEETAIAETPKGEAVKYPGDDIKIIKMEGVLDFLEQLRHRPRMYMARPSIELMEATLHGFMMAQSISRTQDDGWRKVWAFRDWLAKRFKISASVGWCAIIVMYNDHEQQGFDAFWRLWDEFSEKTWKRVAKK